MRRHKHANIRMPLVAAVVAALLGAAAASQDHSGEAFYAAIRANDLPRLNGMLEAGASVNAKDERGITPLMYSGMGRFGGRDEAAAGPCREPESHQQLGIHRADVVGDRDRKGSSADGTGRQPERRIDAGPAPRCFWPP